MPKDTTRGVLLVLLSAAGYGSTSLFAKAAYAHGASTVMVLAGRYTTAAVILWVFLAAARPRGNLNRSDTAKIIAAGIGGNVVVPFLYFSGLRLLPLPVFVILSYTYPAFVTLLAFFLLKEPLSASKLTALAMTMAGCGIMFWSPGLAPDARGVMLTLASAAIYSLYIVCMGQYCRDVNPQTAMAYTASTAALCFLSYSLAAGEDWGSIDLYGWVAVAGMAVFSTAVASVAFFTGVRLIGASRAALASTVEPVFTIFLARLLLGDAVTGSQITGGLLVVGALLLIIAATPAAPANTAGPGAENSPL